MLLPLKMANSSDRQLKKLVWNAVTDSCSVQNCRQVAQQSSVVCRHLTDSHKPRSTGTLLKRLATTAVAMDTDKAPKTLAGPCLFIPAHKLFHNDNQLWTNFGRTRSRLDRCSMREAGGSASAASSAILCQCSHAHTL